jgi:hypothetical protein
MLFWVRYAVGTFGPILGNFLVSRLPQPHGFRERTFLWLWLAWLCGAGLLIACVWSVRAIPLGNSLNSQRPVWLYRAIGWLALVELVFWGYAVVRVI